MQPSKLQLLSSLMATQDEMTPCACERQEPSIMLSAFMYSMSSQLRVCLCVCMCGVWGGGWLSIKAVAPPPASLCLITWAWGKVLIMLSFIQTINPEAQCTGVPPRETSHIWLRLCYNQPPLTGLLGLYSFSFFIQRLTWIQQVYKCNCTKII